MVRPWKSREICRAISCTRFLICSADSSTRGYSAWMLSSSASGVIFAYLLNQDCLSSVDGKSLGHGKPSNPDDLPRAFNDWPQFSFCGRKLRSQATGLQQLLYFLWGLAMRGEKSVTRPPVSNRKLRRQQDPVQ